jgi:hypothetical protein
LTFEVYTNVLNSLVIKTKFSKPPASNTKNTLIGSKPGELTRFINPRTNILSIYNLVNTVDEIVKFSMPGNNDPKKIDEA